MFPHLELAPAKLTVSLRITGVRDDGYHLIDAEMVTVDLADTLAFGPGDGLEVGLDGPAALDRADRGDLDPALTVQGGPANLVTRALRLVGRTALVRLTKRIPVGAGLGGGSADAAAVLRWAGVDDVSTAAALGADVPFCVRGGRARVSGVGDLLAPLPPQPRTYTLLIAPFGCSTVEVYRAWDRLGGPQAESGNDLEAAALAVEPRLASLREALARTTGMRPRLAGSGSTWFVEGSHPGPDRVVVRTAR